MRLPKSNLFNQVLGISSVVVLVVGLLITFLAWQYSRNSIADTGRSQFEEEVNQIEYALTHRIKTYSNILYALQGLFAASVSVDRQEWSPFVKTARIVEYPDISYVSYIEILKDENKAEFIESFRNDLSTFAGGYPNLTVYPEGTREEYAVIKYIDPENDESIPALGFDVFTSPQRKTALDLARDTNQPVASEFVNLTTDNSLGFIIAAPVYENGAAVNTTYDKRTALRGFVVIALKDTSLFADAFPADSHPGISYALYDGDRMLYTSGGREHTRNSLHAHPHTATKTIEIGTRTWILEVVSESAFTASIAKGVLPWVIAFGGIVFSLLLFFILYSFGQRANQLIRLQSTALETAANGVVITDIHGFILWVNAAFTRLTGYQTNEAIGQPTRILNSGIQSREYYHHLWSTIKSGKTWSGELTNKRKDGSLYQEEQFITPVTDRRGHITHFIAVKQDISQRKANEAKILSVNKELEDSKKAMTNVLDDLNAEKEKIEREFVKDEAIFSAIGEGLIVIDQAGKILMVNHAFEQLLGWKKAEVIGREMTEVIPKYDENGVVIPKVNRAITKALTTGKKESESTLAIPYYYTRRDQTKLPIVGVATPIVLNNKTVGAVQVFRNISDELEINRMKDEFLNIAAHDLRTPSAAVRGFISRVLDGDAGVVSDKAKDLLQSAYEGNKRLIRLVDDFLMVSRIERGKITVEPKPGNLSAAVEKAVSETAGLAKENGLYLKYEPIHLPQVLVDEERIIELLINLIGNALKFTSEGGVTITHEVTQDMVITNVIDSGIGISKQAQQQLFRKYFKVSSQEVAQSGLGLGLYISKLIMDGHGGTIWVTSEEGKGATFSFSLNVAK